ncbi:MAG: hypothetical protein E7259_04400 [Lachnospiraceae bacterium]|nr:hypothetical protein [Lachnospiraceae bacterium]
MLKQTKIKTHGMAYFMSFVMGLGIVAMNTKDIELQAEETPDCVMDYAMMEEEIHEDMHIDEIDVVAGYYSDLYVTGINKYSWAYEVLNILNQERVAEGLTPLSMDKDMLELSMLRAAECNVCYGHYRPNGGTYYEPFWELPAVNYYCGENIAMGQTSPSEVMEAWMESDGHRENILNPDYTSVGIGCFKQDNGAYCWVQVFGAGTATEAVSVSDKSATHRIQIMSAYLASSDFSFNSISVKVGEQTRPNISISNQGSELTDSQAAYFGADLDLKSFSWTSSDTDIATVTSEGIVTGIKAGEFNIIGVNSGVDNLELVIQGQVISTGQTSGGETPGQGGTGGASEGGNSGSEEAGNQAIEGATWFAYYQGCDFYQYDDGNIKAFYRDGSKMVRDEFKCDGVYTYYFQYDGTAMKDRLTYHPNGINVIYFDSEGHEVFSDFAHVKKSIEGNPVNDYCFFDVYGYLYVDVVTYDKTGTYLYYANPYGVLERGKWFQFSDTVMCADGTPWSGAAGKYGYANTDGTLMVNTWTYDWNGNLVYMEGNGTMTAY